MSTVAFRASLVRELNQAIQIHDTFDQDLLEQARHDGMVEAYAHVLTLVSDMEDQ